MPTLAISKQTTIMGMIALGDLARKLSTIISRILAVDIDRLNKALFESPYMQGVRRPTNSMIAPTIASSIVNPIGNFLRDMMIKGKRILQNVITNSNSKSKRIYGKKPSGLNSCRTNAPLFWLEDLLPEPNIQLECVTKVSGLPKLLNYTSFIEKLSLFIGFYLITECILLS